MPNNKNITLIPITAEQSSLVFSSEQNDAVFGGVGHLRMDFGSGNEFHHSWWGHRDELNNSIFKQDLQTVVDNLRDTVLKDLSSVSEHCLENSVARLDSTWDERSYGFKAETEGYEFYLRLTPERGNYCYLYCYDKSQQTQDITQDEKTGGVNQCLQ